MTSHAEMTFSHFSYIMSALGKQFCSICRLLPAKPTGNITAIRFDTSLWRPAPKPLASLKYVINPDLMSKETAGIRLKPGDALLPYIDEEKFKDYPNADLIRKALSVQYAKQHLQHFHQLREMLKLVDVDIATVAKDDITLLIVEKTLRIQLMQESDDGLNFEKKV